MTKSYSYSKIGQFQNCPRRYKFNYIEKATVEKPVSVEMFLGSAVHRSLEKLYKFKVNGRIQPVEEMLADYHKDWEGPDRDRIKVTREHMGIDDFINVGKKALEKYHKMYEPFDEGEIIGLEKKVNFPLDSANRFMMRAQLDKLIQRADGVVEIIDYKTQSRLPTQQDLDNNLQMALYQHAVNFLWPQFDKIELKQIYLRQGIAMSTVMDQDKLDMLKQDSINSILEIEQAARDDDFPVRESALCDYCPYFELCPAKRHRQALEDESADVLDPKTGKELAEKYLQLNYEKKKLDSELKA
ncbi:MAG: PD-(D/E)XK nuclease family protein, partial [candidate division Zixibacteria bacterium]|nr:PD-(D/E)XK nuclease family protein [candidate division Zixibacteria bacterium]